MRAVVLCMQKMAEKPLTAKQAKAAALCAEDELRDDEIAAAVGIALRTLGNWKTEPWFLDAVGKHVERVQAAMLRLEIAKKHKRVETLNELYLKAKQVIDERADAYATDAEAYGGSTGLIVKSVKIIGTGKNAQTVTEYQADIGLMKEVESLMLSAAKELGQITDKSEQSTNGTIRLIGINPEDI